MSNLIKQQLMLQQQQQLQQQALARASRSSFSLMRKMFPRSPFYCSSTTKRYDLMPVGEQKLENYVIMEEYIDPEAVCSQDVLNSELYDVAFLLNQMVYYVSYQYAQEQTEQEMEELELFEKECWATECERRDTEIRIQYEQQRQTALAAK